MAASRANFADLRTRSVAAIVMVAAAAAAVAAGGWAMAGFAAALAAGMGWELRRMTCGRFDAAGWLAAVAGAGACLLTQAVAWRWGVAWTAACLLPAAWLLRGQGAFAWRATLGGAAYVALSCSALVGLRDDALYGWEALLWVALTVAATDVGGYFFGRMLGGPRLWPAVSPGKTWSGFLGGVGLATLTGALFSAATTDTWAHEVAIVSALMAAVAQGGDLGESALKRRAGVKDSSRLIPGHGGLLDRLDGLLAAGLVAAVITFLRGQSVFVW
ncbi:MAG: phosphatidate cytidylyltransferase [Pseudomonadota bacterium]